MKRTILPILILILISYQTFSQKNTSSNSLWPKIEKQMKPWTRWWWMGSAVDEKNIASVMTKYQQAGLGGVEITPIYGAVGFENRYVPFLSPKWIELLHFTVKKSAELGLGVDMNTGTGWPFGGPQIKSEQAATKFVVQKYEVAANKPITETIKINEPKQEAAVLQALIAYGKNGEKLNILDKLTSDGKLSWTPASGNWDVYALFSAKTRQQVKRAAPGGEGFTLDHLDKNAVGIYLKRFNEAFSNKPQGVRAFFNDSYEVYGANWTPTFFTQFEKGRGYDLRDHLAELVGKDSTSESIGRLKSDYRETMNELLLVNFTKQWTDWAHGYQSLTKNQSHGSPGNLLDLYGTVDIPETETFGSSKFDIPGIRRNKADIRNVDPDPLMSKFASSAAHTNGKNLVSSETFTWLTEHFKTSFSQAKPEAEQLFLSGVNHIFYHGTTNSPDDAVWPGWLFYASVEFNPNNSLWPHINGLNNYIARCQSILQAGKSDNELLIYWPVYDVWNQPKGLDMALKVHDVNEWLHPTAFYKLSKSLAKSGYSLDFASDLVLSKAEMKGNGILTQANANPYRVLIIPAAKMMNVETLRHIFSLARAGATVIFEELPQDVPGLNQVEERKKQLKQELAKLTFTSDANGIKHVAMAKGDIILAKDVAKALAVYKINREELTDSGLQFIRRKIEGGKYYYLVNHTSSNVNTEVPINESGSIVMMDPQTGLTGLAQSKMVNGQIKVRVQLKSGEALILKVTKKPALGAANWMYLNQAAKKIELRNPWSLHFTTGGPALPEDQKLEQLVSWTELADPKLQSFSGTGVYTTTFNLTSKTAKEYVLNLNQVDESAKVWINGKEVGILWSVPFEARIGKYLKAGNNEIKVEVVNLMANRIRDMDLKKIQWRNYHEINFVNIDYKPFDASGWNIMPSGLIGPVTITPYN